MGYFTEEEIDSGLADYIAFDSWGADSGQARDPNDKRSRIQRMLDRVEELKKTPSKASEIQFQTVDELFEASEWSSGELDYYQCLREHLREEKFRDADPHGRPDALYLYDPIEWAPGELEHYRVINRLQELMWWGN